MTMRDVPDEPLKSTAVAPTDARPLDLPPTMMIVDRLIRIQPSRVDGWLEARFIGDNRLTEPPMRLLPSARLGEAEKWLEQAHGQTIRLRLSGEITEFRGRRYLLLRSVIPERQMGQF